MLTVDMTHRQARKFLNDYVLSECVSDELSSIRVSRDSVYIIDQPIIKKMKKTHFIPQPAES